jgi:hypothetical protein
VDRLVAGEPARRARPLVDALWGAPAEASARPARSLRTSTRTARRSSRDELGRLVELRRRESGGSRRFARTSIPTARNTRRESPAARRPVGAAAGSPAESFRLCFVSASLEGSRTPGTTAGGRPMHHLTPGLYLKVLDGTLPPRTLARRSTSTCSRPAGVRRGVGGGALARRCAAAGRRSPRSRPSGRPPPRSPSRRVAGLEDRRRAGPVDAPAGAAGPVEAARQLPPARREERIVNARTRYRSRAFAELLVEHCRERVRSAPREAAALLELVPTVPAVDPRRPRRPSGPRRSTCAARRTAPTRCASPATCRRPSGLRRGPPAPGQRTARRLGGLRRGGEPRGVAALGPGAHDEAASCSTRRSSPTRRWGSARAWRGC